MKGLLVTGVDRWLKQHGAPWMTHTSLVAATAMFYGLLAVWPLWVAFVPCIFLAHRIGILLHEYFHGLGFRRYVVNHAVVTIWDGVMLMFGMMEVLRGLHLAHHREVGGQSQHTSAQWQNPNSLAVLRYLARLADACRGRVPYVQPRRILVSGAISVLAISVWVLIGRGDVPRNAAVVLAFTVLVPVSLRGAVEHHGEPGRLECANDYRTIVPMFNVNRHLHHHQDAAVPWYRLEWRAESPLPPEAYLTYWYGAHVSRRLDELPVARSRTTT